MFHLNNHKITNTFIVEKNFNICLTFSKVYLNNGSVCDFMVVQLFKISTKDISLCFIIMYNSSIIGNI